MSICKNNKILPIVNHSSRNTFLNNLGVGYKKDKTNTNKMGKYIINSCKPL